MSEESEEPGPSRNEKRQLFTSNVSSIFDLKGELYRKKQERRIKDNGISKPKKGVLLVSKQEEKKRLELSKARQEKIATLERQIREEEEAEKKRKKILEEKSEAYSRLSNGKVLINEDGQQAEFLVDFDAKKREDERKKLVEEAVESLEAEKNEFVHFVPNEEQRVYGVSHVSFSQSEAKRREQIKQLLDLTKKTDVERQVQKETVHKREEEKLERLNRIRKRKGLPEVVPEVIVPEKVEYLDIPLPPKPQDNLEEKKRKLGVREWDKGKVGYMRWIEAQRDERNEEFQPPLSYYDY